MNHKAWEEIARNILKKEIRKFQINYFNLSENLQRLGIFITENEAKERINHGQLSAHFWLQCLYAIGVNTIDLGAIIKEKNNHDV